MRYVPCGAASESLPHVMVAGRPRPGTVFTLSNWPGSPTPTSLLADTTAETVLRFLRSSDEARRHDPGGVEAATSERFSAGAALALWALLNPDASLARAERVIAAARAAELGVTNGRDSTAFVCTLNTYADPDESPVAAQLAAAEDEDTRSTVLFEAVLPEIGGLLDDVRRYDLLWIGEYSDVLQGEHLLDSGAVQIETVPDLDLVVVDTLLRLHPLVHGTVTAGHSRVLTVRSENTYALEYRYESWVQYQSYRPTPRVDLRRLAARLDMFERRAGRWRADPVDQPRCRLFFDDGRGAPSPSSLDRETAVAEMLDYLRDHRRDAALLWSPYGG